VVHMVFQVRLVNDAVFLMFVFSWESQTVLRFSIMHTGSHSMI